MKLHCTEANCKWGVTYEDTVEGWVLCAYTSHVEDDKPTKNGHGHSLIQDEASAIASSNIPLDIPDELLPLAVSMAKTNRISAIDRTLRYDAASKGIRVMWTRDTLRNQLKSYLVPTGGHLNCENLLRNLEKRRDETGLQHYVEVDDEDVMCMVFIELDGGKTTWSRGGTNNVVLFDPTWGTNKEGYKLAMFTSVGSNGATEILAAVLLLHEYVEYFHWSFTCFTKVRRNPL